MYTWGCPPPLAQGILYFFMVFRPPRMPSELSRSGQIPYASESKSKLPVNLANSWQAAQRA